MKRTDIDIDTLAALSGIALCESEKAAMAKELSDMIAFADRLPEIEAETETFRFFAHGERDALREDRVKSSFSREALIGSAASRKDGYVTVPCVIDKGDGNA